MSKVAVRLILAVIFTVTLGGLTAGPPASASNRGGLGTEMRAIPSSIAGKTQRLIQDLERQGYEVSVGYPKLYTQSDCDNYTYLIFENCFANNPASPYIMPVVKSWPDEYVDPTTVNGFGKTRPGYSATYRLDKREAIVVLGEMPPSGRYMGLQSWVFTQHTTEPKPWNPDLYEQIEEKAPLLVDYLFGTVPDNTSRLLSFSSLSNNINNVVMAEQSETNEAPFGQTRSFIITPDQAMDDVVRTALEQAGIPGDDIFTEPIPQYAIVPTENGVVAESIGPIGLDEEANDFLTALRYAMPDDERAADTWRSSLPLTVLRIREAPASDREAEPYTTPFVADTRSTEDESYLADGQQDLIDAVCAQAAVSNLIVDIVGCGDDEAALEKSNMVDILHEIGQYGPLCRYNSMDCMADGQDASYFFAPARPIDDGQVYAVVGALATETDNATYVGLSVNNVSMLKGVANLSDDDLRGSAVSYEGDGQNFGQFFVHFLTRDCSAVEGLPDGACTSLTEDMIPLADDTEAEGREDLHGYFSAALRAYVKPGTKRGPDVLLQLTPRVLAFTLE